MHTLEQHKNNRLYIKSFKTGDAMNKFLCGVENNRNQWSISSKNYKSGIYAFVSGEYRDIKKLPASLLAHI